MRLVLGVCKVNRSPHRPARILKLYTEVLAGLIHISGLDALNITSPSQDRIHGAASESGDGRWNARFKDSGRGCGASDCWGPAHGPSHGHILLMTSSNTVLHLSEDCPVYLLI